MKPELLKGSRSRILAAIVLLFGAVFVVRLFQLQILQHSHYVSLAQNEQVKKERLPAKRGEIYALSGATPVKLVLNETVYTVFVDPVVIQENDEEEEVASLMKQVAGGNVRDGFEKLLAVPESRYQIIATRVTRTQAEKIKEKKLLGIGFTAVSQRVYPEGTTAGQVLGFVNAEGVGNYGVEGYLNKDLSGTDGRLETVTDVSDVPLTIGDRNVREPARDGENIVLSIDRNIQAKTEDVIGSHARKLGATLVSAVVMDPNTGKVMAMANTPSYDPAKYYTVTDASLFNNAVVSKPYEPGSTIKTFTMGTALEKSVARPGDTFYNTDHIKIDGYTISNATLGMTGQISFQTAMDWSLNTGFVTLGMRMGDGVHVNQKARSILYDYFYNHFRLGQRTGIELANEAPGSVISPQDAEGNEIRYANMTFGQGMESTMIQIAAGFSALVNGGTYYAPTIIDGKVAGGIYQQNSAQAPLQRNVVSEKTSKYLRDMIVKARRTLTWNGDKQGYQIGGKTGTAQVPVPGGYSDKETIASYVGFGGQDRPQYVIMVSVYGKNKVFGGSTEAMPVFTDISNWMLDYLKIQPKG